MSHAYFLSPPPTTPRHYTKKAKKSQSLSRGRLAYKSLTAAITPYDYSHLVRILKAQKGGLLPCTWFKLQIPGPMHNFRKSERPKLWNTPEPIHP